MTFSHQKAVPKFYHHQQSRGIKAGWTVLVLAVALRTQIKIITSRHRYVNFAVPRIRRVQQHQQQLQGIVHPLRQFTGQSIPTWYGGYIPVSPIIGSSAHSRAPCLAEDTVDGQEPPMMAPAHNTDYPSYRTQVPVVDWRKHIRRTARVERTQTNSEYIIQATWGQTDW
ncbi:uncharacterized protein LOC129743883 [Uranotaenia lowii]|uniref:uncharacterized protein LOC129743882 n=1 Tax=Uranotaenia lowii TaxID=190385 RepID=UPI002478D824|nr:uncharacterized protein LOC129743882 [Uranotaenia lowii]XP_055592090.1 uncharacterized protein LOC129743883 [Uranotaenia lowii]